MKPITLHNKTFEVFIPETEISAIVHSMANQINNSGVKDPLFIAVMNGAFLFAADVMRKITIPNELPAAISDLKISPVDKCTKLYLSINKLDCVPLPAPGGPNNTKFNMF